MRVGLVILHADPMRGGAERYTVDLGAALCRRGISTSLISSTPGPAIEGVRNVVLPSVGITRTGRYRHWIGAVEQHLRSNNYDIVHSALPIPRCDVYHPHAGLAADAVLNGHRKHQGWTRWTSRLANQWNRRRQAFANVERKLVTGSKPPIVISLSKYVQTAIESFYDLPAHRHACLFNAVDLQRFDLTSAAADGRAWRSQHGLQAVDIVALMIAQDFERKGLTEAIAALAAVADPRLKLVVVGKPNPEPWRQQAAALGISQRVIFAGPTTRPAACYAAADVFVLPTKHDPCSLVVLEALAMGVPVITTSRNGAAEVMTGEQEGIVLADPANVPDLSRAYQKICEDNTRRKMSQQCLELRPKLSYDHHVQQLLAIYDRALQRPARAA